MATQNLFEKYGIKEVADVTFYRIEKKEETYEAQREIKVSSILKGAIELQDVYPLTENGIGDENGFKAYVFKDAEIIKGINYDCDDVKLVKEIYTINFKSTKKSSELNVENEEKKGSELDEFLTEYLEDPTGFSFDGSDSDKIISFDKTQYDVLTGLKYGKDELKDGGYVIDEDAPVDGEDGDDEATIFKSTKAKPVLTKVRNIFSTSTDEEEDKEYVAEYKATYTVYTVYKNEEDITTGIFDKKDDDEDSAIKPNTTLDANKEPGTHEYTYAEQVCMLFATRQNLITKTGTRYQFKDADTMFGDIIFDDSFASGPSSTEKVVVVGMADSMTEGTYDIDAVNEKINALGDIYKAKGYDIIYSDYAELVVEDEMGYYNPAFLGYNYTRVRGVGKINHFTDEDTYANWAAKTKKGVDMPLSIAEMWEDGIHYSINDAIEALRQKQKALDANSASELQGIKSLFGGYKVSQYPFKAEDDTDVSPAPGTEDIPEEGYENNKYKFSVNGEEIEDVDSTYPLTNVLDAVKQIGLLDQAIGRDIRVDMNEEFKKSNRAIYIGIDNALDTSAGSFIYLLHNRNFRKLSGDIEGIFEFEDKKGNILFYQDKIFKGVEWLALVIIGNKGMIFVVNRHGKSDTERIGWMINESGYVTDSQAKKLAANGLIHTTDITANNETFQATCTVKSFKVHKTVKEVNRYVPVLFLDTLKVSTIEQTAEEVYATGGKGNANLIGWDYGKEITLSLEDALFTPASMSAIFGSYEGNDFRKGVKEAKQIDRFEKCIAKRNFIVPAGNMDGTPSEANHTAQAVFYDPKTMEPYADGTPIAEGEIFYKFTRSVAYEGQSIGKLIEISADKFPGTYKIVGDTFVRSKDTGEDERFQFIIPQAKMTSEQTITLEADGDPAVFDMNMTVLRPEDGVMVKFIQYNVVENEEENDGSTMVKDTENLNLLDDAELFKVSNVTADDEAFIGATEY